MAVMMKVRIMLVSISLLVACPSANSVNEFEQWKQQQLNTFQDYKDERDREFTAFLEEHWHEIELMKGFVRDDRPKPPVIPVARPEPVKQVPDLIPVKPLPVIVTPEAPVPLEPIPVPAEEREGVPAGIDYFGRSITFYYDPALIISFPDRPDEKAISEFWSATSKQDYESLLTQLGRHKLALQLDDWGYAVLINRLAQQIYPASANRQALFGWFLLTKSGYKSRIAYDENKVYLLLATRQQIYDVTYFTYDNQRYYAVSFGGDAGKPGSAYTYDGHYPGAANTIDMTIRRRAAKASGAQQRSLTFEYGGTHYDIDASYDKAYVEYLDTYPQLDLGVYFESEVGATAESPLLQQLAKEIKGMNEQEAVNFLLRFVQTALKYKTDEMQFGKENYLFPEETIYYPYSDCEDRSVLFAWLIRRLLGLEIVGLSYPGHVATAVRLTQVVDGDYVTHNGRRYTVADPTYINATVGMTMPEYIDTKPDVITIN